MTDIIADQQKARKQDRDDSIKQFSIHPSHIKGIRIYIGPGCMFYAIIPTLFPCFLLICYPYILLHFF